MNRLTKVVSIHNNEPEFYEANIDLYPEMMGYEYQLAEMDCIDKLGQLEDIMEKYNIDTVEKLELIIKDQKRLYNKDIELSTDLGMYQNENEHLTKDIEKYWELEQQLGCDLDVVFKALMNGIVDKKSTYTPIDINLGVQLYNGNPTYVIRYIDYEEAETIRSLGFNYFPKYWLLKDYQKTWWLANDKKEKDKQ